MSNLTPIIAIIPSFSTDSYLIPTSYTKLLSSLGALPVILPYETAFNALLPIISGVLLIGGGDPDPYLYNAHPSPNLGSITPGRDFYELSVIKTAYRLNIPTLGICRGCQIMNVALGGTLTQHIPTEIPNALCHNQPSPKNSTIHSILLNSQSLLYTLWQKPYNRVNSFHHQAIKTTAKGFILSAFSPDGVIEAIECPSKKFFLGVQWHPELMTDYEDQQKIFAAFIKAAKITKEE